jgi:hypothetical protein
MQINRSKTTKLQIGLLFSPLLVDVQGRIDLFEVAEALPACPFDDISIQLKT